jgi:hypothetical protein
MYGNAGKGDKRRPENTEKYRDNYENIFFSYYSKLAKELGIYNECLDDEGNFSVKLFNKINKGGLGGET